MANKTNTSTNFFETILDAQQKAVETLVENTKKYTNGNAIVNETIEKGSEMLSKTFNATKETLDKATAKAETVKEEVKNSTANVTDYFTNWKNQQQTWANQMLEMNKQFTSNTMNPTNMMSQFQNMPNMFTNMMNQNPMANMQNMMNQNPMANMMNSMNPASMQENMNKSTEQVKAFWNQFQQIMTNNYQEMAKNFQPGTAQDSFKGMVNMTDGFAKFYEMWMPMMKSINDKTFNLDMFKANLDMNKYKEFMDKYLTFMPEGTQDYMQKMTAMYQDATKNGNTMSMDMLNNLKSSMNTMMPEMFGNPYTTMLNNYNNMTAQMTSSASPFGKLMTPTNDTKSMQEWAAIMNKMNIYNIKNSEMQFMVYQNGMKVMEKIAENTMNKVENGEEVDSMMKMYQEWLNTSDAMYVSMFETDEYSKLMAEVSSLQLGIKKDIQLQVEKSFANVPVATRSEMDEVYQTIYDLKRQVRQLQSMLEVEQTVPVAKATTETKKTTTAKKTAKK